jgi:hypothetical protein
MPPHFWLWAGVVLTAIVVGYFRIEQGKLEEQKAKVLAKQRAVAQELGPKILPFRDKIEGWARELAGPYPGNLAVSGIRAQEIAENPGVYLRLRIQNARDAAAVRKAATRSLHDGFTSCFFVRRGESNPTQGPACRSSADCQPGLLCNEFDVCRPPPRPYNMRLAYRAMRVLSPEWLEELHEASSKLAVTAYDRDLDAVTHHDVPIAARILQKAKYFTLVLDEEPEAGLPKELPDAGETEEERVQRVPHMARVGIWNLKTGEQLLRWRSKAAAQLVAVGQPRAKREETVAAQARQANSCALAIDVRDALAN